jgi:hypothetical protein
MKRKSTHVCKHWFTHRRWRRCDFCGRQEWQVVRDGEKVWEQQMTVTHFGNRWLPVISGTKPVKMMVVEVAMPFEFNSYESWDVVQRVRFEFPPYDERLETPAHVLDGWQSNWHEVLNRVDAEAELEYEARTGHRFRVGDNLYAEMRRVVQL